MISDRHFLLQKPRFLKPQQVDPLQALAIQMSVLYTVYMHVLPNCTELLGQAGFGDRTAPHHIDRQNWVVYKAL